MADDPIEQHFENERREASSRCAAQYPGAEIDETSMRIDVDGYAPDVEVQFEWVNDQHARHQGQSTPHFTLVVSSNTNRHARATSKGRSGEDFQPPELERLIDLMWRAPNPPKSIVGSLSAKTPEKPRRAREERAGSPPGNAQLTTRSQGERRLAVGVAVFLIVAITVLVLGPGSCLLDWIRWIVE